MDSVLEDQVKNEIRMFVQDRDIKSAHLFRPCNNYFRFQIHQMVQNDTEELKTFSVGLGKQRRLVLGWAESFQSSGDDPVISPPPPETPKPAGQVGTHRKRPDQQIYVPKHKRVPMKNPSSSEPDDSNNKQDVFEEIKKHLGQQVKVEESAIVFPAGNKDDLPMPTSENVILEVYDFDSNLKTADILNEMVKYRNKFEIKWVDDTHALAVFVTEKLAESAMSESYTSLQLRPLNEGCDKSQEIARLYCLNVDFQVTPRPETSTLVARRMLGGALGVSLIPSEMEKKEREKIREARMKKSKNL